MANRYWVGGTASWDATAGTKWSTTSGGGGGSAVPTSSDDVFFDAASGAVTITQSGTRTGKSFTTTGFTGTFAQGNSTLNIAGDVTVGTGMTWTFGTGALTIIGTCSLTTNGFSPMPALTNTTGGTTTLQDNYTTSSTVAVVDGTFNANNKNISANNVGIQGASTVVNMGSGTWTVTPTFSGWSITAGTLNANTSTIRMVRTNNNNNTFTGGGKTYNNVWFDHGTSTAQITITGTNTFNDFKDDGTAAHTIVFPNATTTVTTFTVSGTSGNLITLSRTGGSGTFTLSQASGTVNSNYLSISNSDATGGATWNAGANSTDGGGNTGWIFSTPSNNSGFLAFM